MGTLLLAGVPAEMQVICIRLVTVELTKLNVLLPLSDFKPASAAKPTYRDDRNPGLAPFVREWGEAPDETKEGVMCTIFLSGSRSMITERCIEAEVKNIHVESICAGRAPGEPMDNVDGRKVGSFQDPVRRFLR